MLKKYGHENKIYGHCGCNLGIAEMDCGEYYKVSEVDAILNSAQQLKAEIYALGVHVTNYVAINGIDNNIVHYFVKETQRLSDV